MPGLNSILGLESKIELVKRDLDDGKFVREAVEQNQEVILEKNRWQLEELGMNSLGISIDSYRPYAPLTVQLKKEKGQPFDRVTLKDTGAFHKSFFLVFTPVGFSISARDSKTESLVDKYGESIFGLTEESRNGIVTSYVYPYVLAQTRKEIFQ